VALGGESDQNCFNPILE